MDKDILKQILNHKSLRVRRSDVSRNLGVPVSTIKFYTQEGLLKVAGTTEGGMTLYDLREVADRLTEIEQLKQDGKSLAQIKALLLIRKS